MLNFVIILGSLFHINKMQSAGRCSSRMLFPSRWRASWNITFATWWNLFISSNCLCNCAFDYRASMCKLRLLWFLIKIIIVSSIFIRLSLINEKLVESKHFSARSFVPSRLNLERFSMGRCKCTYMMSKIPAKQKSETNLIRMNETHWTLNH